MRTLTLTLTAAAAGLLATVAPVRAAPPSPAIGVTQPAAELVLPVAEGCGWGRWRGPWGGCRGPGSGPYGWGGGNGCPPGWWRGPWGHCRDTPYHGRLPGGGWQ